MFQIGEARKGMALMASQWFYRRGTDQFGPISAGEIRSLSKAGKIVPNTPIRKSDDANWINAKRIKGLFDGIETQPEVEDQEGTDPLIALASQTASSVASATSSAASAVGGAVSDWLVRRKDTPPKVPPAPESVPSETVPSWLSKLIVDNQPPDVVTKVAEKVREILIEGEELTYVAIQQKPVVNWMPDCIALTDKRFIFYRPKVFGRVDFEDYIWRELHDANLSENIIGSTFTVMTAAGKKLSMDYLPKSQARAIYRIAQAFEERSLEERRNRDMEEKRAAAGGVVVHANPGPASPNEPVAIEHSDPMQKLRDLKNMADEGLISAEEYEAKKAEILSQM